MQKVVEAQNIPLPNTEPAIPTKQVQKEETQHRYLQNLIKKMAEAKGYKATLEAVTTERTGKVDLLLEKDGKTIACEVSVTTNADWEIHNIKKCLDAGYDTVISCMAESKGIALMTKKTKEAFSKHEYSKIIISKVQKLDKSLFTTGVTG